MNLARAIHFDESDTRVYPVPARTGEWCIPGGFEFSNWTEADLAGKARQAFSNGWFGLETTGRVTFVAVTQIELAEFNRMIDMLAEHFVTYYDAPNPDAARPVAAEEMGLMAELCDEHAANTLLTVSRELTDTGVREAFRVIEPQEADLGQFAIHETPDGTA